MQENSSVENVVGSISNDLMPHETNILELYNHFGLPVNDVLAKIDDRKTVLNNLNTVIE